MNSNRIPLTAFQADDSFVGHVQRLVRDEVIPYQYQILNDALPGVEKSHAVENIRLAAKKLHGGEVGPDEFYGAVFQDSDVAKWIEAAACSLASGPNPELEQQIDALIDLYGQSQHPDGYVNSFFTIKAPDRRWSNLRDAHELYCAGHMIEAAVAYYEVTGKRSLLDIMCRNADCIYEQFMVREPRGCSGHPEIELALMRLARATGSEKYQELARHFVDVRGQEPNFFREEWKRGPFPVWGTPLPMDRYDLSYSQAAEPVRRQKHAVGHAVRAGYLYTAMADVARAEGDSELLDACRTLWQSITQRQMYITGGIGSTVAGEAFTTDYDLPNDTVYAETCASISLMLFARAMLENEHRGEYADVMEQAFYNTVLAGMQLDGKRFFYVNPLEVIPGVSGVMPNEQHVLPVRPQWYACACCPPNVARTVSSLGAYAYSESGDTFFIDLYAGGTVQTQKGLRLTCRTGFPYDGAVCYTVSGAGETTLAIRVPSWSISTALTVNGQPVNLADVTRDGYAYLTRVWQEGDQIALSLDMTPRLVYASPRVAADSGKACVRRGALVYCAEEPDNGTILPLRIDRSAVPEALPFEPETLGGITPVTVAGFRAENDGRLYSIVPPRYVPQTIRLIPYYTWANRGPAQMRVWLPLR